MKLFVLSKSLYWRWILRPIDSNSDKRFSSDPLDEHHTYFYYLLLKYGVVDEVIVYSDRKKKNILHKIPDRLDFPEGKMRISYDLSYAEIRESSNQLIYCRDHVDDARLFPQHFIMCKFVAHGFPTNNGLRWIPFHIPWLCRKYKIHKSFIDLQLSEGPYNRRFFPKNIVSIDWPSLSNQKQYINAMEKKYDWICISSMNPRKRVLSLVKLISKHKYTRVLKGCLVVNKITSRELNASHFNKLISLINRNNLDIKIYQGVDCKEKIELLCQSKVYVSPAAEDSGPRTVIEAGAAEVPVLALKHHGSASFLVKNGINGELTWRFKKFPNLLKKIITNYDKYDCAVNQKLLDEALLIKPLIIHIKRKDFSEY